MLCAHGSIGSWRPWILGFPSSLSAKRLRSASSASRASLLPEDSSGRLDLSTTPSRASRRHIRKADKVKAPRVAKALLKRKLEIVTGRHALAGRTILPTIHPAFVLRSDTWNAIMAIDFDRISRWVRGKLKQKDLLDNVRAVKHPELLKRQGDYYAGDIKKELAKAFKRLGPVVSCDIETTYDPPTFAEILCVGVSDGKFGVVIGPWDAKVTRSIPDSNVEKEDCRIPQWIRVRTIALTRDGVTLRESQIEDTLIAHHAFASHFPQKLRPCGEHLRRLRAMENFAWPTWRGGEGPSSSGHAFFAVGGI